MRVLACQNIGSTNRSLCFGRGTRCCTPPTPKEHNVQFEYDYGKCLKQLSYILGITILGITGILMAIKGKKAP